MYELTYEHLRDSFNEYLDFKYQKWYYAGPGIKPSEILAKCRPQEYESKFQKYLKEENITVITRC